MAEWMDEFAAQAKANIDKLKAAKDKKDREGQLFRQNLPLFWNELKITIQRAVEDFNQKTGAEIFAVEFTAPQSDIVNLKFNSKSLAVKLDRSSRQIVVGGNGSSELLRRKIEISGDHLVFDNSWTQKDFLVALFKEIIRLTQPS